MADAERWAAGIGGPAYAIDDETAIKVVDGAVEVVSEGHWKLFRSLEAEFPALRAKLHTLPRFLFLLSPCGNRTGLRERKKAETRAAIRQAVLRLALKRGLEAVTADDIAAAANVSVRTFHNYFGTKEEALVAAWRSEFQVHVDALRDRPAGEPILVSLEHVFVGHRVERRRDSPEDVEAHVDLLWTSLAMARYRSVLLDEAIRMVTEVVAARTGTDAATDVYPHLVTAGSDLGDRHRVPVPARRRPAPPDRERLLHECFALLRAGLEPGEGGDDLIDGRPGG